MKTIVVVALLTLSTVLRAQVESISIPEFGGAKVLHHCKVIEVQADGVKVSHDDGISAVALRFLPKSLQRGVQAEHEAEAATRRRILAETDELADAQKKEEQKTASAAPVSSPTVGTASPNPASSVTAKQAPAVAANPTTTVASGPAADATTEPTPTVTANSAPGANAQAGSSTEEETEMMARKSRSKSSSNNQPNYPVATIPAPVVHRTPTVRFIPIPYRAPSATPQITGPGGLEQ